MRLGVFNVFNAKKVEQPYCLDLAHREHRDLLSILCALANEEKGDEHWDQDWFRWPEEKECIENYALHDFLRKWSHNPKAIPEKGYVWLKYTCEPMRDGVPTYCAANPAARAKLNDAICLCGASRAKQTELEIELPSSKRFVQFDASGDNTRKHFGIGIEPPPAVVNKGGGGSSSGCGDGKQDGRRASQAAAAFGKLRRF